MSYQNRLQADAQVPRLIAKGVSQCRSRAQHRMRGDAKKRIEKRKGQAETKAAPNHVNIKESTAGNYTRQVPSLAREVKASARANGWRFQARSREID